MKKFARKILPSTLYNILVWARDSQRFALFHGPVTHNVDGIASRFNADFMTEARYRRAHDAGQTALPEGNRKTMYWIMHVVFWAADIGARLEGDFVECGVHHGFTARALIDYVDFPALPKTLYLLDTFCGLDPDLVSETEKQDGVAPLFGAYDDFFAHAERNFNPFPNVRLVRGAVPGTLDQVPSEKVAFLHLDMSCTAPSIAAAEFFWPKMVPGAVMILNDYGSPIHYEQKLAFDDFSRRHATPLLSLPTGQAIMIKLPQRKES